MVNTIDDFLIKESGTPVSKVGSIDDFLIKELGTPVSKVGSIDDFLIKESGTPVSIDDFLTKESGSSEESRQIIPTVTDPDSFSNRVGRSFNEFQRAFAEGIGSIGRLTGSEDMQQWSKESIAQQEEDIKSYGNPRRTSSFTEGLDKISEEYDDKGLGSAIDRSLTLAQDMLGDALGYIGVPIAAGLAAIPAGILGAKAATATALLAPFLVGGVAGTGQVKEEALKQGASLEDADKYGVAGGALIGLFERLGASFVIKGLIKQFGKDAITKKLGQEVGEETAKNAIGKALTFSKKVGKGGAIAGIAEMATETGQEYIQMASSGLAADKGLFPYEGAIMRNRLIDAGAMGLLTGKTLGSVTTAAGTIMESDIIKRRNELEEMVELLENGIVDNETELAATYETGGTGIGGREKSDKLKEGRSRISGIMASALTPLFNMARKSPDGNRVVNLFAQFPSALSSAIGIDAESMSSTFNDLKRSFKIPLIQRAIPKSISKRVWKVVTNEVEQDSDPRINKAASEIKNFFGTIETDPETGKIKLPVKLEKETIQKLVFDEQPIDPTEIQNYPDLQKLQDGDITPRDGRSSIEIAEKIKQTINELKAEYRNRINKSPTEKEAIQKDILASEKFKNLTNEQLFTPKTTGFYDRMIKAGIPLNFSEGYVPRVYKTGRRNRKKIIRVLTEQGKSKFNAKTIADNIEQNEGAYNPIDRDVRIGQPEQQRIKESDKQFMEERSLSKDDVNALEKAGLVETDIQSLIYKYIIDANRKLLGKQIADEVNRLIPSMVEKGNIGNTEISHLQDVFNATQNKLNPLSNRKLQAFQKWMLTSQYILTLPLAGLTALSEPFIILSRTNPKYALFGAANAAYNSLRSGLRMVFPKISLREKEKAFKGILEGLDGSLAERFGDIAGVTVARKITNAFFRATLLTTVTQISRDIAFQATRLQMRDDLKTIKEGKKDTKGYFKAKKRLLEQGIVNPEAESVKKWLATQDPSIAETSTPLESDPPIIRKALSKTVNEFIMAPNAINRPLWMSDPRLAAVAQLKGFMMVFGNTVGTRLWREVVVPLSKGRIPLEEAFKYTIALASIMAVAMYVQGLKDEIRYGEDSDESPFSKLDGKEKLLEAVLRTNIMGGFTLVNDALRSKDFGGSFWASLLGPTANTIEGVAEGTYDYILNGNSRNFAKQITNLIPLLRNIPQVRPLKKEFVDSVQDSADDARKILFG